MMRAIIISFYNFFTCKIKMGSDIESIKPFIIDYFLPDNC